MRELPQIEGDDDCVASRSEGNGLHVPLRSLQVHELLLEEVPGGALEIPQGFLRSCWRGVSLVEPSGGHRLHGEGHELGGGASEGRGESRGGFASANAWERVGGVRRSEDEGGGGHGAILATDGGLPCGRRGKRR